MRFARREFPGGVGGACALRHDRLHVEGEGDFVFNELENRVERLRIGMKYSKEKSMVARAFWVENDFRFLQNLLFTRFLHCLIWQIQEPPVFSPTQNSLSVSPPGG